jgi:hypothetical protein
MLPPFRIFKLAGLQWPARLLTMHMLDKQRSPAAAGLGSAFPILQPKSYA